MIWHAVDARNSGSAQIGEKSVNLGVTSEQGTIRGNGPRRGVLQNSPPRQACEYALDPAIDLC